MNLACMYVIITQVLNTHQLLFCYGVLFAPRETHIIPFRPQEVGLKPETLGKDRRDVSPRKVVEIHCDIIVD